MYYPPDHNLEPLVPFLQENRLRVCVRPDDKWGARIEQLEFLKAVAGGVEGEGEGDDKNGDKRRLRRWVQEGKIEIVDADDNAAVKFEGEGINIISSTKVRDAIRNGDEDTLKGLLTLKVAEWVLSKGLYVEEGNETNGTNE